VLLAGELQQGWHASLIRGSKWTAMIWLNHYIAARGLWRSWRGLGRRVP
jgi:hypothetical protein